MTFARRTINDGWSVEPVGEAPSGRLDAVVPGSIHHDLIAEGVIPHPDTPGGEAAQVWVGKTTFRWRRHVAELERRSKGWGGATMAGHGHRRYEREERRHGHG